MNTDAKFQSHPAHLAADQGFFLQGMLLQLELPAEVKPSASTAQRSAVSGHMLLTMPKERPGGALLHVESSRSAAAPVPVRSSCSADNSGRRGVS